MLSLPEKLMLLALHDKKGSVIFSASTALPFGLAGSVLIELLLRRKVELVNAKIKILENTSTGNELLDEALNLIYRTEKLRDAKYWVQRLNSKIKGIKERVLEDLINKGILIRKEQRIMWVIPTKRYPMINAGLEEEIRGRIHQVVIQQDKAKDEDIALLSLINACELINEVFKKEERKRAKQRIKEITEEEQIGEAVSSIVTEIIFAISAAVAVTIAASSASN